MTLTRMDMVSNLQKRQTDKSCYSKANYGHYSNSSEIPFSYSYAYNHKLLKLDDSQFMKQNADFQEGISQA